jgi:hypothetical protein
VRIAPIFLLGLLVYKWCAMRTLPDFYKLGVASYQDQLHNHRIPFQLQA